MRRLAELPGDVQELIVRHWSAMRLQRGVRRWLWFRHTRRTEVWRRICAALPLGIRRDLARYAHVRREWRHDPSGWLSIGEADLLTILHEARAGLWGSAILTQRVQQ